MIMIVVRDEVIGKGIFGLRCSSVAQRLALGIACTKPVLLTPDRP